MELCRTLDEFRAKCATAAGNGISLHYRTLLRTDEVLQGDGIAIIVRKVTGMTASHGGAYIFGWRNDELLGGA